MHIEWASRRAIGTLPSVVKTMNKNETMMKKRLSNAWLSKYETSRNNKRDVINKFYSIITDCEYMNFIERV